MCYVKAKYVRTCGFYVFFNVFSVHSTNINRQISIIIVHSLSKNHINAPNHLNKHVNLVYTGITTIQYILYQTIRF